MDEITIDKPQRWDAAFDPDMTDADLSLMMASAEISGIDGRFPDNLPLEGIVRNDMRILRCRKGDIIVREGDYGSSAFILLEGEAQIPTTPIPINELGGETAERQGFIQRFGNLFRNTWVPEVRDTASYKQRSQAGDDRALGTALPDVDRTMRELSFIPLTEGAFFGELAALGRTPRTATIFASSNSVLMEIRWQGLRDIMKFDEGWRRRIDENYRRTALGEYLRHTDVFKDLPPDQLKNVIDSCLFETYGSFDWHRDFKVKRGDADEPVIARGGDYPDGALLIRAGFARLASHEGHHPRTVSYLGAGDVYGLSELYDVWRNPETADHRLSYTLTGLGHVDVIRIPVDVLERYVFDAMDPPEDLAAKLSKRSAADDLLMEWAVDNRYMNGTKTMVIDLNSCVRCDDCVRACAATHGGDPRFTREGQPFGTWLVANACMHCKDPVCMVGCPTGAIRRDRESGSVIINDLTCIGCATCANSCPYDNITMVSIRDLAGRSVSDEGGSGQPIMKATKCDLCTGRPGGPACVQACPNGSLSRVDFREFQVEASS